jgi:hypothetical protein
MENRGLLFIPDISGFTRFVNTMEIEHSRLIIQELLEILINANGLGLEISEIEGDAILFYKFGAAPDLGTIYKQVEKMFCEFHRNLVAYEYGRFCQCRSCSSAIGLSLKVITHYGEFTGYQVKEFKKLIGKDIIVAHQLLKNDIEQHEYWLVSNELLRNSGPVDLEQWLKWDSSSKQTEAGTIPFHYTALSELKKTIPALVIPELELTRKLKVLSLSREYDHGIISLFHATGDFRYRSQWRDGVRSVEELPQFLPRVGMRCRCVSDKGKSFIYTSSYSYRPDLIQFSETDEEKKTATYYLLEKIGENRTRLTMDYYLRNNFLSQTIFKSWRKKNIEASLQRSLQNLEVFLDRQLPVETG